MVGQNSIKTGGGVHASSEMENNTVMNLGLQEMLNTLKQEFSA